MHNLSPSSSGEGPMEPYDPERSEGELGEVGWGLSAYATPDGQPPPQPLP